MPWIIVYVSLATAGLAVLAVLGVRVFAQVRHLAGAVRAGSEQLAEAVRELEEAAAPLADRVPAGRD